jgi:hypothetical protein
MQLLELVVFDVGIETCAAHGIGIVLVRDWAVLPRTGMPGRNYAFPHDASMVRGGTVIMRMVSSEAPTTDLPHRTVILVVVRRVLIALKAVREGSGRPRLFALLSRKEVEAPL